MIVNEGDSQWGSYDWTGGWSWDPKIAPFISTYNNGPDSYGYTFDENAYSASLTPLQIANLATSGFGTGSDTNPAGASQALQTYEQNPDPYNRSLYDDFLQNGTAIGDMRTGLPTIQLWDQALGAMGMSPDERYQAYMNTGVGLGAGLGEYQDYYKLRDTLSQIAQQRGYDPAQFQQILDWYGQQGDYNQQLNESDLGLPMFLAMVAATALGGGALLGGGFAPASATALGAGAGGVVDLAALGGIAGGGFGSVVPGVATTGLGGATGALTGATGALDVGALDAGSFGYGGSTAIDPATGLSFAEGAYPSAGAATGSMTGVENIADMYGGPPATEQSLLEQLQQVYNQTLGQLPPGSTSALQQLMGSTGSGTGTGTGSSGSQNSLLSALLGGNLMSSLLPTGGSSFGINNLLGMLPGILQYFNLGGLEDKLEGLKTEALQYSDPYGLGPYRQPMAQRLEQSYADPLSIWNSPEMQALDRQMQNSQLARDAQAGQLFNAPERLAQRQDNFLTKALPAYRQGLLQPSGATFAPRGMEAVTSMMGPLAGAYLGKNMGLGMALQGLMGGSGTTGRTTGGTTSGSIFGGTTGSPEANGTIDEVLQHLYGVDWGDFSSNTGYEDLFSITYDDLSGLDELFAFDQAMDLSILDWLG
jgi:hypothetical protein